MINKLLLLTSTSIGFSNGFKTLEIINPTEYLSFATIVGFIDKAVVKSGSDILNSPLRSGATASKILAIQSSALLFGYGVGYLAHKLKTSHEL